MASFLDRVDPALMFQLSAGLLGGKTAAEQSSGAMTGLSNYYTASQDKRKQLAQTNKTLEWLRQADPNLAAQVEAGMPAADAFKIYNDRRLKAQTPAKVDFQKFDDGSYGYFDPTTREVTKLGTSTKPVDTSKQMGGELDTMKAYRGEDDVKTYREVRNGYERVRASAVMNNGQGDISLIFGYMKMLDPGSVVREGEYANAQNTGGVSDTIRNMYNQVKDGQRLTPEQRQQFVQAADALYNETASNLQQTNQMYGGFADQYGVPTDRFMVSPEKYEPLKLNQSTQVTIGGRPAKVTKVGD